MLPLVKDHLRGNQESAESEKYSNPEEAKLHVDLVVHIHHAEKIGDGVCGMRNQYDNDRNCSPSVECRYVMAGFGWLRQLGVRVQRIRLIQDASGKQRLLELFTT